MNVFNSGSNIQSINVTQLDSGRRSDDSPRNASPTMLSIIEGWGCYGVCSKMSEFSLVTPKARFTPQNSSAASQRHEIIVTRRRKFMAFAVPPQVMHSKVLLIQNQKETHSGLVCRQCSKSNITLKKGILVNYRLLCTKPPYQLVKQHLLDTAATGSKTPGKAHFRSNFKMRISQ